MSTDIVPTGTVEGTSLVVPSTGATTADLIYAIKNNLSLFVEEGGTAEGFLLRTLEAEPTEAAIIGNTDTTKSEEILDVPFKITAYRGMRNSDFESRLGVYAIVDVVDKDGSLFVTSIGSEDAVCKIVRFHESGLIPTAGWYMLSRSTKATKAGFYPINLVAAPDPTAF